MASTDSGKLSVEEFYEGRAEVQELVSKGIITQDIMDGALEMVARENNLLGIVDMPLNQRKHNDSPERTITILPANPNMKVSVPTDFHVAVVGPAPVTVSKDIGISALSKPQFPKYISLTKLARSHHTDNPSYTIQSWLRSENTLAFLDLWEQENNPSYDASAYVALLEKKKSTSFTITSKQWIEQTKAIGITSKQGKQGGTFAHPIIACQFATWLSPKYMMRILELAEVEDDFFDAGM